MNWKVKLYEATPHREALQTGVNAKLIDTFGVSADEHDYDGARKKARAWLDERAYRVRAISHTTTKGELVAYIEKPKTKELAP